MLVDNTTTTPNTELISALSAVTMPAYDEEYTAFLATVDNPFASLNWDSYHRSDDATSIPAIAYSAGRSPIARANELPFILNTGTTCHISPEASDFKSLRSILRHPVKGLCSSAIYAIGVGDIELHIAGGHSLKLVNALYIPTPPYASFPSSHSTKVETTPCISTQMDVG
jgi:hypothetical protein